jgi:hypothetical protein
MSLQHALRAVAVDPDKELERAVESALVTMEPDPDTGMIKRSRDSFARNLTRLQEKIDAVNADVVTATKARDEAIAQANDRHAAAIAEADKKLYQATTLRAVIETAHATLTQARDE